jgi:hypothetical protein
METWMNYTDNNGMRKIFFFHRIRTFVFEFKFIENTDCEINGKTL